MSPGVRKFALTSHIATSVAWIGAVCAFLALSVAALKDPDVTRSAYISMNLIGAWVIVPFSFAALASGLWVSLVTSWGLVRHYWVLCKLTLTVLATLLLVLHQFTAVESAARRASRTSAQALVDVGPLARQLVMDASLAIVLLIVITGLSVYKPWGRTPYGIRAEERERDIPVLTGQRRSLRMGVFIAAGILVLLFLVMHVAGGGMARH